MNNLEVQKMSRGIDIIGHTICVETVCETCETCEVGVDVWIM